MKNFRITGCAALVILVAFTPLLASPLTPKEKHGKQIYSRMTSPSGQEINAFLRVVSTEAPGSAMPCINCHGYDGLGRPESGVTPSNITWKELTKPYGVRHLSGRERPAYTEETLARAITKGIDPAGNKLDPVMPVFSMPREDLDALVAYIKQLGTELDPGLTAASIRIGTILPMESPLREIGESVRRTIQAYFDDVNEKGGIYSRKLELVVEKVARTASLQQVTDFVQKEAPFALLSTFTPGLDGEIPSLVEEQEVPLIGPFTLFPQATLSLNRYLFYLLSGVREQARALIEYASGQLKLENPRIAILHPARKDLDEVIEALEKQCKDKGWQRISKLSFLPERFRGDEIAKDLKESNVDIVLCLGAEREVGVLLREAKKQDWMPYFLFSGVLAGRGIEEISGKLAGKVFLAFPTLPEDRKERGAREFTLVARKYDIPTTHPAAQLSAFSSARILLEGLKRSGRDLSREKLISALEKLYEFDTGLTPPITYGPNKHIGAMGAYIVTVNPEKQGTKDYISSRKWIALE